MIHLGEPSKGRVVHPVDQMSETRVLDECGELPHDEDDFLWTVAMYFKVEGMTFERSALVANLSDWTHATTSACMRVEYGLGLVGHCGGGGGGCVKTPVAPCLYSSFPCSP